MVIKRSFIIMIALFVLISNIGCAKNTINNSNGEIELSEYHYTYQDGVYYAYGDYFDADGYITVMRIKVSQGIIVQVRYDKFNQSGESYSKKLTEENQNATLEFSNTIKGFNQSLLQNQTNSELTEESSYMQEYMMYSNAVLYNAEYGTTEPAIISTKTVYSISRSEVIDSIPLNFSCEISYRGDNVTKISFSIRDNSGIELINSEDYLTWFNETYGFELPEMLQDLNTVTQNEDIFKEPFDKTLTEFYNIFNSMTLEIENNHKTFDLNYESLFSN